jgi:hypothetical protein
MSWINQLRKKMQKVKSRRKANAVAKDLRTPKYRLRVVESKIAYDRKKVKKVLETVDLSL